MVLSSPGVPGGASCHRSITIVLVLFLIASKRTTRTIPAELANHQLASCRSRGSDSDTPASTTNVGQATICPLAIFRGPGKMQSSGCLDLSLVTAGLVVVLPNWNAARLTPMPLSCHSISLTKFPTVTSCAPDGITLMTPTVPACMKRYSTEPMVGYSSRSLDTVYLEMLGTMTY